MSDEIKPALTPEEWARKQREKVERIYASKTADELVAALKAYYNSAEIRRLS